MNDYKTLRNCKILCNFFNIFYTKINLEIAIINNFKPKTIRTFILLLHNYLNIQYAINLIIVNVLTLT